MILIPLLIPRRHTVTRLMHLSTRKLLFTPSIPARGLRIRVLSRGLVRLAGVARLVGLERGLWGGRGLEARRGLGVGEVAFWTIALAEAGECVAQAAGEGRG